MTDRQEERERATLAQVVAGVLAAFFGVRRRAKHEEGMRKATPGQVIWVGLILVGGLVLLLVSVVWLVVRLTGS
jgi:uncharacterized membrane protein YidH (DUF202 family)